jgi:hypothetical protein
MSYTFELYKSALSISASIIALLLAWFVGNRIGNAWTLRQKRKEIYLAARTEFFRLYGEFFSIWKAWNYLLKHSSEPPGLPEGARWETLKRACSAEAGVEAILVRLSTEQSLLPADIASLGKFRQAYHRLRENIRADQPIPWNTSDHPEYLAFKTLACDVVALLDRFSDTTPTTASAKEHLVAITSNTWENEWVDANLAASQPQRLSISEAEVRQSVATGRPAAR